MRQCWFFFHICFHFLLMFPDNLQHKYTTDNILRWQMHDNLCYLFHLSIHPAIFFIHLNSIQISNNKKKYRNMRNPTPLLRQWQHVIILTLVYDISWDYQDYMPHFININICDILKISSQTSWIQMWQQKDSHQHPTIFFYIWNVGCV